MCPFVGWACAGRQVHCPGQGPDADSLTARASATKGTVEQRDKTRRQSERERRRARQRKRKEGIDKSDRCTYREKEQK